MVLSLVTLLRYGHGTPPFASGLSYFGALSVLVCIVLFCTTTNNRTMGGSSPETC